MNRYIFVHIVLSIIGANCQFCDYYWRDYSGKIPQDALAAGQDASGGNTYIGQVYVQGHGLFVGQIYPPSLEVELGCYGYKKKNYIIKILCSSEPGSFRWLSTSHTTFHIDTIGEHAVVGGYDHVGNRGIIHIGRAMHQGVLKIGFVASHKIEDVIFNFAHNKRAEKAKTFQVLICEKEKNPFLNGVIEPRFGD